MDLLHQPPHWISRLPDGQRVPVRFPVRQEAAQDRRGGTRPYGVWVRLPAAHARPRREGGLVRLRPHRGAVRPRRVRSEEHTSELQSQSNLVCRLLLEKKKKIYTYIHLYDISNC